MARTKTGSGTRGRPAKAASASASPRKRGPEKGFKKSSNLQTIQMNDALREHFHVDTETGRGSYDEGWSDERIAEEVGVPHKEFVARMRRELYGSKQRAWKPKMGDQIGELRSLLSDFITEQRNVLKQFDQRLASVEGFKQNPQNLSSANQANQTPKAA